MREQLIAAGIWDASDPRDPSASIEAAWQVVERMRTIWRSWSIGNYPDKPSLYLVMWLEHGNVWQEVAADTAPLAICRAALKTLDRR
jgi:hypothetical protein